MPRPELVTASRQEEETVAGVGGAPQGSQLMLLGDAQVGTERMGTHGEPGRCCKHGAWRACQEGSGKSLQHAGRPKLVGRCPGGVTGAESLVRILSELGTGESRVSLN